MAHHGQVLAARHARHVAVDRRQRQVDDGLAELDVPLDDLARLHGPHVAVEDARPAGNVHVHQWLRVAKPGRAHFGYGGCGVGIRHGLPECGQCIGGAGG